MSKEQTTKALGRDNPSIDRDAFLELLIIRIENAEENGDEDESLNLTLNVGGSLISGTLISRKRFVQSVPAIKTIVDAVEAKQPPQGAGGPSPRSAGRYFVHLKDARFFHPGGTAVPVQGNGVYWRGRLSCVDGFTIGGIE